MRRKCLKLPKVVEKGDGNYDSTSHRTAESAQLRNTAVYSVHEKELTQQN